MSSDRGVRIAASIMAADIANLGAECRALEDQGADWIHVDVMDGHFVANQTFGPGTCAAIRPHIRGVMDVHLMCAPPDRWIAPLAKAGADIITVHCEAAPHVNGTFQAIRASGCRAGVALNPGTPIQALESIIEFVDLVCLLTVNPGFGGQKMLDTGPARTAALRTLIGTRPVLVEIDGGVDIATAPGVFRAGADVLVAGGMLVRGGSADAPDRYGDNIRKLRAAALG